MSDEPTLGELVRLITGLTSRVERSVPRDLYEAHREAVLADLKRLEAKAAELEREIERDRERHEQDLAAERARHERDTATLMRNKSDNRRAYLTAAAAVAAAVLGAIVSVVLIK